MIAIASSRKVSAPSASASTSWTAAICQRVPIVSHLAVLLIAIFGPSSMPLLYASVILFAHLLLLTMNMQSLWGMWSSYNGVRRFSKTNWQAIYQEGVKNAQSAANSASMTDESALENGQGFGSDGPLDLKEVEHVIIVPNYKEDYNTLCETLDVLSSHAKAKTNYRVCLGMEARENGSEKKALQLISEYGTAFLELAYSLHPGGLEGEMAGKSSNVNWATRHMAARSQKVHSSVFTIVDSDTCLASTYFDAVATKFAIAKPEVRARMMFVVPIVFDRNARNVPVFTRITDILWSVAGMSAIYPTSSIKIPTSAYGVSMELAVRIGFWDAGPEAVGEDMHMFIKAFLSTAATLVVETIYSPASQCNVIGDNHGQGFGGIVSDFKARYGQALRHLWGSLDTGYALRRVITGDVGQAVSDEPSTATSGGLFSAFIVASSDVRDETGRLRTPPNGQVQTNDLGLKGALDQSDFVLPWSGRDIKGSISNSKQGHRKRTMSMWSIFCLFVRLYHAHLLLGHLSILSLSLLISRPPNFEAYEMCRIGGQVEFGQVVDVARSPSLVAAADLLSSQFDWIFCSIPTLVTTFIWLAKVIGGSSVISHIGVFLLYEGYHHHVANVRWKANASLGFRPAEQSTRRLFRSIFEFACIPVGLFFSAFPLFHAQILHLFTNRLDYKVSIKPQSVRTVSHIVLPVSNEPILAATSGAATPAAVEVEEISLVSFRARPLSVDYNNKMASA